MSKLPMHHKQQLRIICIRGILGQTIGFNLALFLVQCTCVEFADKYSALVSGESSARVKQFISSENSFENYIQVISNCPLHVKQWSWTKLSSVGKSLFGSFCDRSWSVFPKISQQPLVYPWKAFSNYPQSLQKHSRWKMLWDLTWFE